MAAHLLDHKGCRAVGQVLAQDGAVDAHEGLPGGKLTPQTRRSGAAQNNQRPSSGPRCGDQLGAGPPSWGADSVLVS